MSESIVHTATRTILAAPRAIYRAFLDPETVVSWRPPKGMTAKILEVNFGRVAETGKNLFRLKIKDMDKGIMNTNADIISFIE